MFLYAFVMGGSVAVIEEWVNGGMKARPLVLGNIAQRVIDVWLQDQP